MNKSIAIVGAVVATGAAILSYRSLRMEPALVLDTAPAVNAPLPAARARDTALAEPRAVSPAAETPAALAGGVDRDTDERSPLGHGSGQGDVETQLSTSPDYPERGPESAGSSLAPALADTRATLEELLAEAGPEALAEAGALADTRAALEDLLEDPDPAVREQVAALLEVLGSAAQP